MAQCPTCKQEWKWSWCRDLFVTPTNIESPTQDLPSGLESRCFCGQRLAILGDEGMTGECPKWRGIDWEDEEHSFNNGVE